MRLAWCLFVSVLAGSALLAACDSGGGMNDDNGNDNRAPNAELTASASEAMVGDTIQLDASESSDPDGDKLDFSWSAQTPDGSDVSLSDKTGKTVDLVADVSGDYISEVEVSDGDASDSDEATVTALEKLPETVTVSFENVAADGDSLVAGTVTWQDSVIAEDVMSGSREIPASREAGELCFQENELFLGQCSQHTPTSDFSQEFTVDRKTVTVSVMPEVPYGDASAVDVFIAGDKKFVGSGSADMPKLSASKSRTVEGNLETADTANASKLDRLYADTSVSANEDIELSLPLAKLPACSDGIDNDGDGYADKADTRACTTLECEYDPQDDNEVLKGVSRGTARYFNDTTFVSSAESHRSAEIRQASNSFPWSITVAKGRIEMAIEVKVSTDTTGEDFAIHLKTGDSNDNLTVAKTSDVVADTDTLDGWVIRQVYGIDRTFFADGPHYAVYMWHGTKARGEPFGDGVDRVYAYLEKKSNRQHFFSYAYEPEDVPDEKAKSAVGAVAGDQALTLTEVGQCEPISRTDEICRVPAGSGKF